MQKKSQSGNSSDNIQRKEDGVSPGPGGFLPQSKFPDSSEFSQNRIPTEEIAKPRMNLFLRVVLPTALFVAAVAIIAWASQNLPNWRNKTEKSKVDLNQAVLVFPYGFNALWRRGDKYDIEKLMQMKKTDPITANAIVGYSLEMEKGWKGYYDYYLENTSPVDVEVGLDETGCDCSSVQISVASKKEANQHYLKQHKRGKWLDPPSDDGTLKWTTIEKGTGKGATIPPGKAGLIRLTWQARKSPGEHLRLTMKLWAQPAGQAVYRLPYNFAAMVVVTEPVRFSTSTIDMGVLDAGKSAKRQFYCWSATRDNFQVRFPKNDNPCISVSAEELDAETRQKMQKALAANRILTNVRTGHKVTVEVHEENDGRYLDIGPILRQVPISFLVDGEKIVLPTTPVIKGLVTSDINVGANRANSINLGSFLNKERVNKTVFLFGPKGTKLKLTGSEPSFLQVELTPQNETDAENKWKVNIVVPPGRQRGPLSERSVLTLESTDAQGKSRMVRIPITGTGIAY